MANFEIGVGLTTEPRHRLGFLSTSLPALSLNFQALLTLRTVYHKRPMDGP